MKDQSLYERLGGYSGISTFAGELLARLDIDPHLAHIWPNSDDDRHAEEKQLLIDFLCANSGGPVSSGTREGLHGKETRKISEYDWSVFLRHTGATMHALNIPQKERDEIAAFARALRDDFVQD